MPNIYQVARGVKLGLWLHTRVEDQRNSNSDNPSGREQIGGGGTRFDSCISVKWIKRPKRKRLHCQRNAYRCLLGFMQ